MLIGSKDIDISNEFIEKEFKIFLDNMIQLQIDTIKADAIAQQNEWYKILQKQLDVFHTWGNPIYLPIVQGYEDEHQILGKGICWGNCANLQRLEIQSPHLSIKDLVKKIKFSPRDRFLQAYNNIRYELDKKENSKTIRINTYATIDTLDDFVKKGLEVIDDADDVRQGVIGVHLTFSNSAHKVYFRADADWNKYHFYDPNIGFSKEFPLNQDHPTHDNPAEEMLACFKDFLECQHTDIVSIRFEKF